MHINDTVPVPIFLNDLDCNEYGGMHRNGMQHPLTKKIEMVQDFTTPSHNFTVPGNKKEITRGVRRYLAVTF